MSEENEKTEPQEPVPAPSTRKKKVTPKRVRPQGRVTAQDTRKTFAQKAAEELLESYKPSELNYSTPSKQRELEEGDQAFILCYGCRKPGVFLVDLPRGGSVPYNMWFSTYKDVDEPYIRKGVVCQSCGDLLKGKSDGAGNIRFSGGHANAICTFSHIERLKTAAQVQLNDWQARKRAAVVTTAG